MKNKHLKNGLIILVVSVIITFIFDFTLGGLNSSLANLVLNILYGVIIGTTISFSGLIARLIIKKSNIEKQPIKTYIILLASITVYISIDVFVVNALWYKITQGADLLMVFNNFSLLIVSLVTIFIGLIIFFILLSKNYMLKLIESNNQIQKAKEEAEKAKFETLKAQVNPHFLFNSLNTLSSLINIDATKADDFTIKLSNIYRYILDHQDNELVSIYKEISFVKEYIYLQSIRFDNNFIIDIEENEKFNDYLIIPMSLQILIENIFKHNVISESKKISISIKFDKNYIIVVNIKTKSKIPEISHKVGIKNLISRYELITDVKCIVEDNENDFTVKLPLIKN